MMNVLQNYCCNKCSPHLISVVTLPCCADSVVVSALRYHAKAPGQ